MINKIEKRLNETLIFIVKPLWTQYYCHQHLTTSTIDIKAIT